MIRGVIIIEKAIVGGPFKHILTRAIIFPFFSEAKTFPRKLSRVEYLQNDITFIIITDNTT